MVGNLGGDDAQTFIDVIHEVSSHSSRSEARSNYIGPPFRLPAFQLSFSIGSGFGSTRSPAAAPEEVPTHSMPDMWPQGFASKVAANPTQLRSIGYPAVSGRVR